MITIGLNIFPSNIVYPKLERYEIRFFLMKAIDLQLFHSIGITSLTRPILTSWLNIRNRESYSSFISKIQENRLFYLSKIKGGFIEIIPIIFIKTEQT